MSKIIEFEIVKTLQQNVSNRGGGSDCGGDSDDGCNCGDLGCWGVMWLW